MTFRWIRNALTPASCNWAVRCWVLIFLMCSMISPAVLADTSDPKVGRIKAAFVYNIAKFVYWPASHSRYDDLNVCFYRSDFMGQGFDAIVGREVHGKSVSKSVISDLAQSKACHILLLGAENMGQYRQEYANVSPRIGLLTVADLTASREHGRELPGVLLSLVRRGSSIGFEVSLKQVRERQLRMSSQLLKLAKVLDQEGS